MSLTLHKLGKAGLRRIGILSFDPAANVASQNRRGLCDGDLEELLIAINGGMEECFALGPVELSEQQLAGVLRPEAGITVNVTEFSQTITVTGYQSWMQGCTVRIPGDTRDNELISATQLRRPFMGATASGVSATVYGDAIPLDSSVSTVMAPVEIPRTCELSPAGLQDFKAWSGSGDKPIGQPGSWTVETRYLATNAFTQRILRVTPMPDRAYSLSYRAKVKPPVYTVSDFYTGTDYGTDPGTIIPFDWAESTLLPVVLQRFSSHPAFELEQIPEIARQADLAKKIFAESAKPMIAPMKALYPWR